MIDPMGHHLIKHMDSVHVSILHLTLPFILYSEPDPMILQDNIIYCITRMLASNICEL